MPTQLIATRNYPGQRRARGVDILHRLPDKDSAFVLHDGLAAQNGSACAPAAGVQ